MSKTKYNQDGDPIEDKPLWMMEPFRFIPYFVPISIITFIVECLIAVFAIPKDNIIISVLIVVLALICFILKIWNYWWNQNEGR